MILTATETCHKTQLFLSAGRLIFCGVCRCTGWQQVNQSWQGKRTHAHTVLRLFISIRAADFNDYILKKFNRQCCVICLFFNVILPDTVFRNNVNERRWQWSWKMIAELNVRPFQAVLSQYSFFSWLKTVVLSLRSTTVLWLVIKPSYMTLIYDLQCAHPIHAFLF